MIYMSFQDNILSFLQLHCFPSQILQRREKNKHTNNTPQALDPYSTHEVTTAIIENEA